jgi:hypothetical protein
MIVLGVGAATAAGVGAATEPTSRGVAFDADAPVLAALPLRRVGGGSAEAWRVVFGVGVDDAADDEASGGGGGGGGGGGTTTMDG